MNAREALTAVYRSKPVRTFAQTLAALVSVAVAAGQGVESIAWHNVLSVALLAAAYSLLQAVADGTPLSSRQGQPRVASATGEPAPVADGQDTDADTDERE